MTEQQRLEYEKAAKEYASNLVELATGIPKTSKDVEKCAEIDFKAGCLHSHEVSRNQVLDEVIVKTINHLHDNYRDYVWMEPLKRGLLEELNKLRS
jgi:hypothetical protein